MPFALRLQLLALRDGHFEVLCFNPASSQPTPHFLLLIAFLSLLAPWSVLSGLQFQAPSLIASEGDLRFCPLILRPVNISPSRWLTMRSA